MSTDIHFEPTGNVWAIVHCEPSIAQELSDFFSFEVPNAKFSPLYREKKWNGKVYLFSFKTRKIYVGLKDYISKFAKDNGYTFSWVTPKTRNNIPLLPQKEHIESWGLTLEPRDYQWLAFFWALNKQRGLIMIPTSGGKSLVIYMISRWLLEHGRKRGLLICPNTNLIEQMYTDFKSYGWDVENNCQKIYQGFTRDISSPFTISTWQSIYDMPKKYFQQFDFVIGDEAHSLKADSLKHIMTNLTNCDYRFGTTGTLDGSKVHKLVIEGLLGPVHKFISTKELMDRDQAADLNIKCLVLKYPEEISKQNKKLSYQDEINFICESQPRNNFITNLAISLEGNTLILFNYIEKHGKVLHKLISYPVNGRTVHYVSGETDTETRETIRSTIENEQNAIIVASYGVFSQGINIKNLHNIIFASPTKSQIRTLQSIGRGLRLSDTKTQCTLYDIVDDMRTGEYVNFALKHYEERMKIYNQERFKSKSINIGLKYE